MSQVTISYTIGKATDPLIKVEVGQWWLYRDSDTYHWPNIPNNIGMLKMAIKYIPNEICAVVVTDIISGQFGGEEIKVQFMIADSAFSPLDAGDEGWFIDIDFAEGGNFVPLWDPVDGLIYQKTNKQKSGADCIKCKQHYPYAIWANNFECWGCRNGY